MKKSIVYSSITGNTKMLALKIQEKIGSDVYCGKINEEAKDAQLIFIGFWTTKFSCSDDIKEFIKSLRNKKIFLFGTAGYDYTQEFFESILKNVKENIDSSNEIVGTYMCQGKVSDAKQKAIKDMDIDKYNQMKPNLDKSLNHPNQDDLSKLINEVDKVI